MNKDKIVSKPIENLLAFFRECEQNYHIALDDEEEMNRITQDILHEIELDELDYHGFAKLSKELRETRKKRREAKDKIKVLLPIITWMENNQSTIKNLERLLGDARKAEKSLENRSYVKRSFTRNKEELK